MARVYYEAASEMILGTLPIGAMESKMKGILPSNFVNFTIRSNLKGDIYSANKK